MNPRWRNLNDKICRPNIIVQAFYNQLVLTIMSTENDEDPNTDAKYVKRPKKLEQSFARYFEKSIFYSPLHNNMSISIN